MMQNMISLETTAPQGWMRRPTEIWAELGNFIVALLVLPVAVLALWAVCEKGGAEEILPYCMPAAMMMAVLYLASRHAQGHPYAGMMVIFSTALILRLFMLLIWPIEPIDDFAMSYHLAEKIATGDLGVIQAAVNHPDNLYATVWSVHMPFVLTEAGVMRAFGGGILPLQICFSLCSAVSCVLTERIGGALAGAKTGWLAGMLMAVNPAALYFMPVLSNQHIALMFCLLAAWLFLAQPLRRPWINALAAGGALTVSNLLRPEMVVVWIAFLCYAVYHALCQEGAAKKMNTMLHGVACVGMSGVLLFGATPLVNEVLLHAQLIRDPMTQSHTNYKLAVGLNPRSAGKWNLEDAQLDYDEAALGAKVRERLRDPRAVARLVIDKWKYQFGVYDYCWSGRDDASPKAQAMRRGAVQSWMFLLLVLFALSTAHMAFVKEAPLLPVLIIILGFFAVYALIEVQDRYNYLLLPLFGIVAAWLPQRSIELLRRR